jgi:DNA polymerase-3 subunit gamma/tau
MTNISLALYRKYRPLSFADVRNQDHIISVLEGALKKKMIPHALLFTGSRGTGKTTVARIFAHAVGASDVDIYEIDAASNRGIDDIRSLKESVHTAPYESSYKVYIIDEVHMLSKDAFNALLKTLEEPPPNVIFILATTERDKVIDTIISRCQVFEFRAPSREELRETVMNVAKKEKFKLDASVADVIALAADGSYRDALGIMEKVIMASGDDRLTDEEVALIVGAPKNVILHDLLVAFGTKDLDRGLRALEQVLLSHVDVKLLYKLLLERLRSVILVRYSPDIALLESPTDEQALIHEYAKDAKSGINSHLIMKFLDMGEYIGKSSVSTLPFELLIIEHCKEDAK